MSDAIAEELSRRCVGEVRAGVPIAELTTLKVGGPARVLVTAEADDDLTAVAGICDEQRLPWMVVGRGSNLLVADAGFPGVVVTLGRGYRGYDIDEDHVTAGAAEPLPVLAVRLGNEGFVGFAWAAAVPGSLGGAVRMNAGAHGSELRDHLISAELFRLSSRTREHWPAERLGLAYRHSELPTDAIVVAATLGLERGDGDAVREEIREIKQWRRDHQPINEPNCGSVFTNPPGDSAGRLIDVAGGKRLRVGGASVAEVHANFIVTTPEATAADVHRLIRLLQDRVEASSGVRLRPEVRIVGEFTEPGEWT